MSHSEFLMWQAFEAVEPFPPFRIDLAGGIVATTLANINRAKHASTFEVSEFMPVFSRKEQAKKAAERRGQLGLEEPVDEEEAILQKAFVMGSVPYAGNG